MARPFRGVVTLESTAQKATNGGPSGPARNGAPRGIGLEIESLAGLPDAEDFAQDAFYRDNFTPDEIAFSLRQPLAKATFAGLLAAKKAILKAGAAETLRDIEIARDGEGRPTYPGCLLSISHADAIAAAVCWRFDAPNAPPKIAPSAPAGGLHGPASRLFVILVVLSLIFLFGFGLWTILHFAFS